MRTYTTYFEKEDFTESGLDKIVDMFQQGTNVRLRSKNITIVYPSPLLIATSDVDDMDLRIEWDDDGKEPWRIRKGIARLFGGMKERTP